MKKFFDAIKAWTLANPRVIHVMEGLLYAMIAGDVAYLKPLLAGGSVPTSTALIAGLGSAAFIAAKLYIQTMIAQAVPAVASTVPPASSAPGSGTSPAIKASLLILGLLMVGTANAGYLISSPNSSEKMGLSLPSGTGLYLLPIEGFQVGGTLPAPTYGLSFNEDLVFGALTGINGASNLAPYFGVGASLYLDVAGVINASGPLECLGGVNLLGPDLDLFGMGNGQGLVPNALLTYNFATGEKKVTGGLTIFANLLPGAVQKLAGN